MNPLTLVKRIQNINKKEATLGISEEASWHAKYRDSAYVYVGGIPFDLTEGDLLAVFAQYGEVVDVNLVRDKGTGKSKGFAFVAYEDQRSTNLAVDNLNGAQILGRTIRVDHVGNYKKKEEEDEETERKKREERGICRAFQRGQCTRGDGCKFSHDEQRAANTGWGAEEDRQSRWVRDKFEGSARGGKRSDQSSHIPESATQRGHRYTDKDSHNSPSKFSDTDRNRSSERIESNAKDLDRRGVEKHRENVTKHKDDWDKTDSDKRSRRNDDEPKSRRDYNRGDEMRSRRYESESYHKEDRYGRRGDGGSARDNSHHHQRTDEEGQYQSRRRVIESDVGKMKNAHQHKVQEDNCRSLVHYSYICSLAWDGLEEVDHSISSISFRCCCEAANLVSKDCMRDHHEWHIYYLQKTCKYASVSCLRENRPSPLIIPSFPPSPTPEQPSPIPQPHSVSPSPTPEQPSPPHPHLHSVSHSPTLEQPSLIPQPHSVSPSPTPEQPSPISHPHSVSPTPTPEQPSPIPQPPSVSPPPTPERPSPDQPPSSPPPTPNHVIPIPRPNPLVPLPPPPPPPPPNHPIRPKNCLLAVVRYDSCNPKAPDTSHSFATPYEKQLIPSESGI